MRALVVCLLAFPTLAQDEPENRHPNIVVLLSDDAGYANFSMHGRQRTPTPRIDSIAANGVRFQQGYVTSSVCSPSRAGLITGRYQQRFGHEYNIPPKFSEDNGLPVEEVTLPQLLEEHDYRTIALGKWHLGYADKFHPLSRGFDDFFGFLQGQRSYFPLEKPTRLNQLMRDREAIPEKFEYLTDELGAEAAKYIGKHKQEPFFLYLSFNAVHGPMHARKEDLAKVHPKITRNRRKKFAAMMIALDRAVGVVLDALEEHGLTENTLVFFVNDNGGATNNASTNRPLRGTKGQLFEGGIRVPFVAQWPGVIPKGQVYEPPVSTLDILPTAITAAGGKPPETVDGVDLMPFLTGAKEGRPHKTLFWRRGEDVAMRRDDWKLVKDGKGAPMLFDLSKDPHERSDLLLVEADLVMDMMVEFDAWTKELQEPRWRGERVR